MPYGFQNWNETVLAFATDLVYNFGASRDGNHWSVVTFSDVARIRFYLDSYYDQSRVVEAINNINYNAGETNIADALRKVLQIYSPRGTQITINGDRPDVTNIVFLVTDGTANREAGQIEDIAKEVRDTGSVIYCIGITDKIDFTQLRMIASDIVDDHVYYVKEFDQLRDRIRRILKDICVIQPPVVEPFSLSPSPPPTS